MTVIGKIIARALVSGQQPPEFYLSLGKMCCTTPQLFSIALVSRTLLWSQFEGVGLFHKHCTAIPWAVWKLWICKLEMKTIWLQSESVFWNMLAAGTTFTLKNWIFSNSTSTELIICEYLQTNINNHRQLWQLASSQSSQTTSYFPLAKFQDKAVLLGYVHINTKTVSSSENTLRAPGAIFQSFSNCPVIKCNISHITEACRNWDVALGLFATSWALLILNKGDAQSCSKKYWWRCTEKVKKRCSVFVDLEKINNRVQRDELWLCLRKSGVAKKYVRLVQDMHQDTEI